MIITLKNISEDPIIYINNKHSRNQNKTLEEKFSGYVSAESRILKIQKEIARGTKILMVDISDGMFGAVLEISEFIKIPILLKKGARQKWEVRGILVIHPLVGQEVPRMVNGNLSTSSVTYSTAFDLISKK